MKVLLPAFLAFFVFASSGSAQNQIITAPENDGNLQKTISQIDEAIAAQPDNSDLYLKKAEIYSQKKDKNQVPENVQAAISFHPNDINLLDKAARLLYISGFYQENIKIGDYVSSLNDSDAFSRGAHIRFKSKFRLGDYTGAMEDIITSRGVFEALDEDLNFYSTPMSEGMLSKTLTALKNNPHIDDYYHRLFDFIEEYRKEERNSTMASLLRFRNLIITVYKNYVVYCEEKKNPTEIASMHNEIAFKFNLGMRAEMYQEIGHYDLAIKDLTEYLKLKTGESNSFKELYIERRADLYVLSGQFDKAIADYEKAKLLIRAVNPQVDQNFEDQINKKIINAKQKQADHKMEHKK